MDPLTVDLPANFAVWLASTEASFLNGRYVWANWDVDELKARADEIQADGLLTGSVLGWPFSPALVGWFISTIALVGVLY
jgi:hypothetical protein